MSDNDYVGDLSGANEEDIDALVGDAPPPPKRSKRTKKPKMEDEYMTDGKFQPGGLERVKKMLTDKVEVDVLKDMAMGKAPATPSPPPAQPAPQPTPNPFAGMMGMGMGVNPMTSLLSNPEVVKNLTPDQLQQIMQMSAMSNPNIAPFYFLSQMLNQKVAPDNPTDQMKNMAEVMKIMGEAFGQKSQPQNSDLTTMLLKEVISQRNQPNTGANEGIVMMKEALMAQMDYWKERANNLESNQSRDPIESLLESRDKMTRLQTVFGGLSPQEMELRKAEAEASREEKRRQYDLEQQKQQVELEDRKAHKQMEMIEKGIGTIVEKVLTPIMEGVREGYKSQITAMGPTSLDPINQARISQVMPPILSQPIDPQPPTMPPPPVGTIPPPPPLFVGNISDVNAPPPPKRASIQIGGSEMVGPPR